MMTVIALMRYNGRPPTVKLGKLYRNIKVEGTGAIKEIGDELSIEMRNRVNVWRGYLKSSIAPVVIDENTVGIKMAYYGVELDSGVPIPQVSFESLSSKFQFWLNEKSYNGGRKMFYAMRAKKDNTSPHRFIQPSINAVRPKVHGIIQRHIDMAERKSGFR